MDFPTIDKYAKLWTLNRKQIYAFEENDTNLDHPLQIRVNTFDGNVYVYTNGWKEFGFGTFYVYEWSNFRERTEDDGYALQIWNKKIIPWNNNGDGEGEGDGEWDGEGDGE